MEKIISFLDGCERLSVTILKNNIAILDDMIDDVVSYMGDDECVEIELFRCGTLTILSGFNLFIDVEDGRVTANLVYDNDFKIELIFFY